uniref:Uncharacterized protein n=1 Tax=Amphimedon queenslandica TaxID=400682 RepID=A0A1X7VRG0_AMPQE
MSKCSSSTCYSSFCDTSSCSSDSSINIPSKKRAVTTSTVQKWILDNNKTLNTATWLKYEEMDCYHGSRL